MIKFLDLAKINNRFRAEIEVKTSDILDNGWYLQGKYNEKFLKILYTIVVSSMFWVL